MDTSTSVLLVIPVASGWDVPAAVLDISSCLTQMGLSAALEKNSDETTLTMLNPDTAQRVKLIITTRENAGQNKCSQVPDVVIRCSEEVGGVLSCLVERLEHLRLFTTPIASHARDEEILRRRLTDLGYL